MRPNWKSSRGCLARPRRRLLMPSGDAGLIFEESCPPRSAEFPAGCSREAEVERVMADSRSPARLRWSPADSPRAGCCALPDRSAWEWPASCKSASARRLNDGARQGDRDLRRWEPALVRAVAVPGSHDGARAAHGWR